MVNNSKIGTRTLKITGSALALSFIGCSLFFFKKPNSIARNTLNTPEIVQKVPESCIIFDLNGVLFTINKQQALTQLGFLDVLSYTLSGKKTEDLENKIFLLLDRMENQFSTPHCKKGKIDDNNLAPLLNQKPLPCVMRDWMEGSLSGYEIMQKSLAYADKVHEENFFSSSNEKKLVKKTLAMIFDPHTRCKLSQPINSGIKLLKKCKKLGHKVFLLSNMDVEFIDELQEKHPEVFNLFDGIVISAAVKAMKPYPVIYKKLVTTYNLDTKKCYLIDDQSENITGAQKMGITGIECDHTDHFVTVRETLRKHGVLPEKKPR